MLQNFFKSTRPQFGTISQLSSADRPMQIVSLYLVCCVAFWLGHPYVAFTTAAVGTLAEVSLFLLLNKKRLLKRFGLDTTIVLSLCVSTISVTAYLYPALCLSSDPSLAIKLTGVTWIMGTQVYLTNTWSRVPVFLSVMLAATMVMLIIAFLELPTTSPEQSTTTEWGIAVGFLMFSLYNTINTLRQHHAREARLSTAQEDAALHLAQLEETHRQDTLTGLLNRRAFDLALSVMLEDRRSNGGEIAVFLLDLDSFKPINDTYSHEAGDEILIQTARRLMVHVGDTGIVGRLGGDEFICAVGSFTNCDAPLSYAQSLANVTSNDVYWNGRRLQISASVGIATTLDKENCTHPSVAALCSAADQAMFASKTSPNRGPVMYHPQLFKPRMTHENKQALVRAINTHTIKPYYQPKIHLPTGQIVGFEALARWEHPTEGILTPQDFIPQIDELGLQGDFMVTMAKQVSDNISTMLSLGLDPGQVSLNVPEVALATQSGQKELIKIVTANPDLARHLTIEITEDVFIARAADAIQSSIAALRDLDVRISLDDFGTGFASFHHLRELDFDELKIDTSFVASLGTDKTTEVLVRGFLSIASGLGVSVVAEGVETEDQMVELVQMGCLTAQGYLFSAAVPFEQATGLLEKQQAA